MNSLSGHPQRTRSSFVWLACCAAMLANSACTTMQPVDRQSAATTLEPGDAVVVTMHDDSQFELVFDDWTSEALLGTDAYGIRQKIDNDDIARVEIERTSMARSVGLGLAVVGMLAAGAYAADDSY